MTTPPELASERHNVGIGALDCWCGPRYLLPCDECAHGLLYESGTGCWRCEEGAIPLTREEAEAATVPIVIVHREEEA